MGPVPPKRRRPYGQTAEGYLSVLKKEVRLLKGGRSSLNSDSPQQSPYTNGFNNDYVVQWINLVAETSTGEPLISKRSFAFTKFWPG